MIMRVVRSLDRVVSKIQKHHNSGMSVPQEPMLQGWYTGLTRLTFMVVCYNAAFANIYYSCRLCLRKMRFIVRRGCLLGRELTNPQTLGSGTPACRIVRGIALDKSGKESCERPAPPVALHIHLLCSGHSCRVGCQGSAVSV